MSMFVPKLQEQRPSRPCQRIGAEKSSSQIQGGGGLWVMGGVVAFMLCSCLMMLSCLELAASFLESAASFYICASLLSFTQAPVPLVVFMPFLCT